MSKFPGVKQTLDLLDNLKTTVGEFAARESKLQKEFEKATASARHQRDKANEELREQLAQEVAEIEKEFESARQSSEERFKARTNWIQRSHKNSKQQAFKLIDDKEGRRKHKIQTETMQMHRNHDSGKANAEKAIVEFKTSLAQEQELLNSIEKKARTSFKGYGSFVRMLAEPKELSEADAAKNEYDLIAELDALQNQASEELSQFNKMILPTIFRHRIALAILTLCLLPSVAVLQQMGNHSFSYRDAGLCVGAIFVLGFILHFLGKQQAAPLAKKISDKIARSRRLHDICAAKADSRYAHELQRVENEFKERQQWVENEWKLTLEEAAKAKEASPQTIETKFRRTVATHEQLHQLRQETLERSRAEKFSTRTGQIEKQIAENIKALEEVETKTRAENEAQWEVLASEWKERIAPIYETIREHNALADQTCPDWNPDFWKNWSLKNDSTATGAEAAKFGRLEVDVAVVSNGIPKTPRLPLPGPDHVSLPLLLTYPNEGSLLIETKESGRDEAIATLNNAVLRLLSVAPPGRISFTVVDPVGLGQSFSGVMHLADFAEHLINGKIWTQSGQIEEKLGELNEHMEKVIQMYLRNEYETIAEYNKQAGNIAEKYHFLVVANFPANFSETALKRLLSIANSGARCGVYTLIHWDHAQAQPPQFNSDELRKSSVNLIHKGNRFVISDKSFLGTNLRLDAPPSAEFATEFIQKVGQQSRDSNRIEVPFSHVTPPDDQLWTEETTSELRVPIGRTGATKSQYLAIGKGTKQHALIAGKTGSGKSTLFHVIITNLALWSSPDEVEFYLIDFKKGVEFKCYAEKQLPHARVVAIESDREFGLSVLQRIDEELKHRGELFRKLSVQDLPGYKRAGGTKPLPRTLLMIDEFQEFFTEDDKISQSASVLLDRIVRQGRAFGIHVILGSQTLGGAYTMARATMGQMVIRIALQCNEADAYLIMDDNNPAPRLLSRPGEGIYNDAAGNVLGNSPFQAVWLSDNVRDGYLNKVRDRAKESSTKYPAPFVFEGDAPADVSENSNLHDLLRSESVDSNLTPRIWLGAPNSIKGPTEAVFQKQSGNNLLVVGQNEEAILSMLSVALVSLAAQFPIGKADLILFNGNPFGTAQQEFLEKTIQLIPHKISLAQPNEVSAIMNRLAAELKQRVDNPSPDSPTIFLFIHGLQKFTRLRNEDEFSFSTDEGDATPAKQLNNLLTEGPAHGIHVIATCDTYNNVNRFLSKKAFSEFEMRVLFQMSANDSASLIDNPRAGSLGLHRALFHNEQQGYQEIFRPYAPPRREWIEESSHHLFRLLLGKSEA